MATTEVARPKGRGHIGDAEIMPAVYMDQKTTRREAGSFVLQQSYAVSASSA